MTATLAPRAEGPDFVGVGIQKSGTTWLGDILNQHPDVLIREKELNFFTHHFHRGYRWYHDWFRDKQGRIAGEITVSYIMTPRPEPCRLQYYPKWNPRPAMAFWRTRPSARDELRARYPGLKVFAMFRNPIDRTWSHYWYWRNRKERLGKRSVPFERMFADNGRWIRDHGMYADHLSRWREAFPDMGVFLYDDLRSDPAALAREAYRFLGVRDDFEPVLEKKVNKGEYNPMPPGTRRMLVDCYRDQVERFSAMIGRDLSHWLRT